MIGINKCSFCFSEGEKNNFLVSNCYHYTCDRCLYKQVVYEYEKIYNTITTQETYKIKCLICENGNYSVNNNIVNRMFESAYNSSVKKILECGNCKKKEEENKNLIRLYCKSCQIYLCNKCFLSHPNNHHQITSDLNQNSNYKCEIHKNKKKFECKTCSLLICYECRDYHKQHSFELMEEKIFQQKLNKINSNLQFSTFTKLSKFLDDEKEEILNKIIIDSEAHIKGIQNFISKIQNLIFDFKSQITQLKENLEISVKNVKNSLEKFFNDLEQTKSNDHFNVFILGKFSNKNFNWNIKEKFFNSCNDCYSNVLSKIKNFENEILPNGFPEVNFKKNFTHKIENYSTVLLELKDKNIACWSENGIELFRKNNLGNIELVKFIPFEIENIFYSHVFPFYNNKNIIHAKNFKELNIWDEDFNLKQTLEESEEIYSILSIPGLDNCFAVGLDHGSVKIYARDFKTETYLLYKEYSYHSNSVVCLEYLPKYDFLLSGSKDSKIKALRLSDGQLINPIEDADHNICSLITLSEDSFASSNLDGEIKIWFIKDNNHIECIKIIKAHDINEYLYLSKLGNDFFVSRQYNHNEFKIWHGKTFELLRTYEEISIINSLIVTTKNTIITVTEDKQFNEWKI